MLIPLIIILLIIVLYFAYTNKNEPLVIQDYDKETDVLYGNSLFLGPPKDPYMKLAPMNIMSFGTGSENVYVPSNDSSDIRTNTTMNVEGFINSEKNVIENLNIYVNGFKSNLKVKKSKQKTAY